MIKAKTLALITAFCSSYIGWPHYQQISRHCLDTQDYWYCSNNNIMEPSDLNRDESGTCRKIVEDCVKHLGSFDKCKSSRSKKNEAGWRYTLTWVINDECDWHWAPAEAATGHVWEANYYWRAAK